MKYQVIKTKTQWCVVQNDGYIHIQNWFFSKKQMVRFVQSLRK